MVGCCGLWNRVLHKTRLCGPDDTFNPLARPPRTNRHRRVAQELQCDASPDPWFNLVAEIRARTCARRFFSPAGDAPVASPHHTAVLYVCDV